MDKAFDLNALGKKLLGSLKPVAHSAGEAVIDWAAESCAMSENGIVKGVGAVLIAVKAPVLAEIDKAIQ